MKTQLRKFLQASLIFGTMNTAILLNNPAFAQMGERTGNGGSISEVALLSERQNLQSIADKVIRFFERTPELKNNFPEVDIEALVQLENKTSFDVVERPVIDHEGIPRTCLNDNQNGILTVVCNYERWTSRSNMRDKFILVAHELFGLLGIEVSSIEHADLSLSYPISSRLAKYLSLTQQYDLVFSNDGRIYRDDFVWPTEIKITEPVNSSIYPPTCAIKSLSIAGRRFLNEPDIIQMKQRLANKGYVFHQGPYSAGSSGIVLIEANMEHGLEIFFGVRILQHIKRRPTEFKSVEVRDSELVGRHYFGRTYFKRQNKTKNLLNLDILSKKRARRIFLRIVNEKLDELPICATGLGVYGSDIRPEYVYSQRR